MIIKQLLIKYMSKKYNLRNDFIKRISKNDFSIIDILKINIYLKKTSKNSIELGDE